MAQVKPANTKKMSKTALIALIVSIALLVGFVLSIGASTGFFIRIQTAASSENFKINGSMASYFTHYYYENWANSDTGSLYIQYKLFDESKPWDQQTLLSDNTKTYADYFAEGGMALAERYLKLCEAAKKAGKYDELAKDAKSTIETYMDTTFYQNAFYTAYLSYLTTSNSAYSACFATGAFDLDVFIRLQYGENVSKQDVIDGLYLEYIASEFYNMKQEEIYGKIESDDKTFNDRINKYFEEHLSSFVTAEYLVLALSQPNTVTFPKAADYDGGENSVAYKADLKTATENKVAADKLPKPDDYVGGENSKAYMAAKAAADLKVETNKEKMAEHKALMDKIAAAETIEEFKTILLENFYGTDFDTAYGKITFDTAKDNKPSQAQIDAYEAKIKDLVIAATIAGKTDITEEEKTAIIEEVLAIVDADVPEAQDTTTKTDDKWKEAMKSLPATMITALNSRLTSATKTVSYSLSTDPENYTNKIFGGVKGQFGIKYAEDEDENGTSAVVGDHWYRETAITALENNIKTIEDKIADLKEDLNKADADKETINTNIKAQEELLTTAKTNLETAKNTCKYTYTAYYVTKAASRDEDKLRNVGHILFKVDTKATATDPKVSYKTEAEAKEAAEKLLKELQALADAGTLTKDKFEEMGKEVTHDSNVIYNDVNKGQMVTEFEDWLFAAEKAGELGLVKTSYGYHIMYFVGETDDIIWQVNAHDGATSEDLEKWYSELDIKVTFNNPNLFRP